MHIYLLNQYPSHSIRVGTYIYLFILSSSLLLFSYSHLPSSFPNILISYSPPQSFLSSILLPTPLSLPNSFYTCRHLDILIYVPIIWSPPNLTPHVLSEWMVEVWCVYLCVVFDSSFVFVLAFERLVFDVRCYIVYYIILYYTIIILLHIHYYILYTILYSSSIPPLFSSFPSPLPPFPISISSDLSSVLLLSSPHSFPLPSLPPISSFILYVSAFGSTYLYSRLIG